MKEFIVTREYENVRVDKMVFKILKLGSTGFIYKMYRKKNIVLNDKKITGKEILKKGDCVKFYLHDDTFHKFSIGEDSSNQTNTDNQAMDNIETKSYETKMQVSHDKKTENKVVFSGSLDKSLVLFEDEDLLVYNKPIGILSQPNGRDDNLIDRYQNYLKSHGIIETLLDSYGVCNRLDRNTTGVILIGKNAKSLRIINQGIANKEVTKLYHAIVKGKIEKELDLKANLTKKESRNRVVISNEGKGDFIHTLVRPLAISDNNKYTLVEVTILTGKSHQIRAHLSSIGYPLIGDGKYGDKKLNDLFRKSYNIRYQMLHSYLYKMELSNDELDNVNQKAFIAPYFYDMANLIEVLFKGYHKHK